MAFSDAMGVVRTHCETVGNAVTPKITIVRLCDIQVEDRQISVEYDGDAPNDYTGGVNTLTKSQEGERISIKVFLPVPNLDKTPLERIEAQLQDVKARIKAALYGDMTLGGYAMGLTIEPATTGKEQMVAPNGQRGVAFRTLTIPVVIAMVDVATIAN